MKKIILLTGSTDGIGLVTAEKFATKGHNLLIHGRNPDKLEKTKNKLNALGAGHVKSYQADLSDFSEVKNLTKKISGENVNLDVIINNAGVFHSNNVMNNQNLDIRFVVNTLSPYLLTKELLPIMNNTGRIINLSSAAQSPVDLDAMAGQYSIDDTMSAYSQSKLAITMWSRYLALQIKDIGPIVIAVNPGSLLASKMVKEGFGVEGKDINIGADILFRLSLDEEYSSATGLYFDNDAGVFVEAHPHVLNEKKCEELVVAMEKILAL